MKTQAAQTLSTASKIWRTVVVSGAMLGTPLIASADDKKPDVNVEVAVDAKVEQLQKDLAAIQQRINVAVDSVVNAQTDADRKQAKAKLELLQKDKAVLEAKLASAKPQPASEVAALQAELAALDVKIDAAVSAITSAQTDADRTKAQATLDKLRKAKADLSLKLVAARTPESAPVRKVRLELLDVDVKIAAAMKAIENAQTDSDRTAATASLTKLKKDKVALELQLKAASVEKKPEPRPRTLDDQIVRPKGRGFVLA